HVLDHLGHQLHQTARAHARYHPGIVVGLLFDDGADERRRDVIERRGLANELVVAAVAIRAAVARRDHVAALAGAAPRRRLALPGAGLHHPAPLARLLSPRLDVGEV